MAPEQRTPATPESKLNELRKDLRANKKRQRELEDRERDLRDDIERWRREDRVVERAERMGVLKPWLVLTEADKADASVGDLENVDFRALTLAVLDRETGIPQRAVFGCDHGKQGGRPPYCGDDVTHDRGKAFLRALHADVWAMMNGVHWTQTTWFEKVFRVEERSADLTDPKAHLHVCVGDLAVLVKTRGLRKGVEGYNGSGPDAVAYAADVVDVRYPRIRAQLRGNR